MAARPATAPDMMPVALMRPVAARSDSAHASAPAQAAKCVLRMAVAALSVAPRAQPPEMPAQPIQISAPPARLSTGAWFAAACRGRRPRIRESASAEKPALMCMTSAPEKSMTPSLASQPPPQMP